VKTTILKRSIIIAGHKTSVSLETEFWDLLKQVALGHHMTLSHLVTSIDAVRCDGNLSSAIRLFLLGVVQNKIKSLRANVRNETAPQLHQPLGGQAPLR